MDRVILSCTCGARLDATRIEPGKKVRCPKCSATLVVPEAAADAAAAAREPSPELDAGPSPDPDQDREQARAQAPEPARPRRTAGFVRPSANPAPPRKKSPAVPLAVTFGGLGIVFFVVLGSGGEEAPRPAAPAKPVSAPAGEPVKVADVRSEEPKPAPAVVEAPKPSEKPAGSQPPASAAEVSKDSEKPASPPPPDPRVALRTDFQKRFATAKTAADVGALLDAAKFAQESGLSDETLSAYEAVLGIDPERAEARAALGFTKYQGSAAEFRGKWLNAFQLARAKEAEAAEAAAQAEENRWTKDEFMKSAASMRDLMKSIAGEWKFQFFADAPYPRPYLIAAQESDLRPPAELAKTAGRVLEALYEKFYEEYRGPLGIRPLEVPVPVWVFTDKEAYEKVHKKNPSFAPLSSEHVGGYYRGAFAVSVGEGEDSDVRTSGFLYLWFSDEFEGVAIHEGTHQLIGFNGKSRSFGGGQTPWFQEGIAEYWSGYEKRFDVGSEKYHFEIGRLSKSLVDNNWKGSRNAFDSDDPDAQFTLRGLVDFGYGDFQAARASQSSAKPDPKEVRKLALVYAQGWALCHFLNQALDKKYRAGFLKYVREELDGNGGPEAFAKCFGLKSDEDWEGMEEEWRTYVLEDLRKQALALSKR